MSESPGAPAETWSAAVASAYDLGRPLRPPVYAARGELGRIWRLDTDAGTWAVKELLVPVEEREVRADLAFQRAAAKAGIRLPEPRVTTRGAVLHGGFRVYAWVDLVDGDVVTGRELGAVTAHLHRIGHPAEGPVVPWFAEPLGRTRWESLLKAATDAAREAGALPTVDADLDTNTGLGTGTNAGPGTGRDPGLGTGTDPGLGADAGLDTRAELGTDAGSGADVRLEVGGEAEWGWVGALGRLLPELVALDALVVPPGTASLETCHRDVNVENVRRALDGGVVVLDWENCGSARPAWELAKILADLPLPDAAQAWRAYRDEGGPGVLAEPADFSMAIAEQGHLLEIYANRAMSSRESAENRSRARSRLRSMLARPLTIARIDALLATRDTT